MKIGNLEVCGVIYKVENLVNGKAYIGQTTNERGFDGRYNYRGIGIERIYKYHIKQKKDNRSYNSYLLRSIEKYGFDNFSISKILDIAFSEEELDLKEQCYITLYDSLKNGYNNNEGGNGGNKGYKHSKKIKQKMKENHTDCSRGKHPNARKIICLNHNKVFECFQDACEFYNLKNHSDIVLNCQNKIRYAGIYKNERLVWMYYEDYIILTDDELEDKIKNANKTNGKELICLTTKKIFNSVKEASIYYNCDGSQISKCCKNKSNYAGKLKNKTPLIWMYLSEYKDASDEYINLKIQNGINTYKNKDGIWIESIPRK